MCSKKKQMQPYRFALSRCWHPPFLLDLTHWWIPEITLEQPQCTKPCGTFTKIFIYLFKFIYLQIHTTPLETMFCGFFLLKLSNFRLWMIFRVFLLLLNVKTGPMWPKQLKSCVAFLQYLLMRGFTPSSCCTELYVYFVQTCKGVIHMFKLQIILPKVTASITTNWWTCASLSVQAWWSSWAWWWERSCGAAWPIRSAGAAAWSWLWL